MIREGGKYRALIDCSDFGDMGNAVSIKKGDVVTVYTAGMYYKNNGNEAKVELTGHVYFSLQIFVHCFEEVEE